MGAVTRRGAVAFLLALTAPLAAVAADGGSGQGLSKDAVYAVVRAHESSIKACYEAQAKKDARLAGEIDVRWEIEEDGRVSAARVKRTTMNSKPVEDCLVAEVARWRFPAASDRTVVGRFPFVFKNGQPPPPPAASPRP
jgi:hypothetical protein